ncbi:MAG: hypothetical protein ABEH88_09120 [Halobacteriales archaeon]
MSTDDGVRTRLREAVHPVDLLAVLLVPVVLVLVFTLSTPTRESLALSTDAPTVVSAYAAHFVHLDSGHLSGNLAVYGVVVPTVYLLAALGDRRRAFLVPFLAVLLSFPFALSALHLVLDTPGRVLGFSGINMAFVGMVPLFETIYLSHLDGDVRLDHAPALFFAGAAVIAFRLVPADPARVVLTVGAGAVALTFAGYAWREISSETIVELAGRSVEFELVAGGIVVFFLAVSLGFPENPARPDGFVGVYTHFLGYAAGFVLTYLALRINDPTVRVPPPPDDQPE